VACANGNIYGLNPQTGNAKWTNNNLGYYGTSIMVGPDGTMYIFATQSIAAPPSIFAIDSGTGTPKYSIPNVSIYIQPCIGPDGTIYYWYDGTIYAAEPSGGTTIWTAPSTIYQTDLVVAADGTLYSLGQDSSQGQYVDTVLHAYNGKTGIMEWVYTIDPNGARQLMGSPAIGADGSVCVVATGLEFYAGILCLEGVHVVSISLDPSAVIGGSPSTGTVTLNVPAPSGGATVTLTSDNSVASVPTTITVPAGQTSADSCPHHGNAWTQPDSDVEDQSHQLGVGQFESYERPGRHCIDRYGHVECSSRSRRYFGGAF
jgi:hypothetical protein